MKKLFLTLAVVAIILSACKESSVDIESNEHSMESASEESFIVLEESFTASEDNSVFFELSEESVVASFDDSSIVSEEESVEEFPILSLNEITAQIASIKDGGFDTNINGALEELAALQAYLEKSGYGYFYCDLEYKGYVSYGCDKDFKTASTAKLPYIKYLCTLADDGKLDLNSTMVYEERHKTVGSGVMKNMAVGTPFSVATLMDYVLRYSDNIAYSMLMERFGLKDYLASVAELGVDYHTVNGYTNCTAAEMAALLYDVARYNGAGLSLIKSAGCNASYNYQIGAELSEYEVVQKYGAIKPGNVAYHDIAVVYAPHPYILVVYTTIDYDSVGKNIPFRTIARLTNDLNTALYGE